MSLRPTKHDNSQRHRPPARALTMAQLAAEFDLAYRKWCRRRGLSEHNDFNFRAQAQAGMGEARAEKRAAEPRKSDQPAKLSATIAALDACPETLPESLLRGRERQLMSKSSITRQTTKQEFARFQATFERWQTAFGLKDWKVRFEHLPIDDSYATLTTNVQGRIATARFNLNVLYNFEPIPERHALHECIHLLLTRLSWIASCRYLNDGEIREEEEALVRRLEKVLGDSQP